MFYKFEQYVAKYQMIKAGDHVVAGVSGGADSVSLLVLLAKLKEKIPFSLEVVHINHLIRKEAGEDADFVRSLCDTYQIPFTLVTADVESLAKTWGMSTEEAGRKVRYDAFRKALSDSRPTDGKSGAGKGKIAVAHNSNDRAETILFNLFRGTGPSGMVGIKPVNGEIIRPLLCFSREEIEAYLKEKHIPYCIDKTNATNDYTRNRIRNDIFPYVEKNICQGALVHVEKMGELMEEQEEYMLRQTQDALGRCLALRDDVTGNMVNPNGKAEFPGAEFSVSAFLKEPLILQRRMILIALADMVPGRKDITAAHVDAIRELFSKEGQKIVSLPYQLMAKKEYDRLLIRKQENEKSKEVTAYSIAPSIGESSEIHIKGFGMVKIRVFFRENSDLIPEKPYTKWFDYDKINEPLAIRGKKTGDFLVINKERERKSLKAYFINEKIPKDQRSQILLLAEGSHILWVIGKRISQYYKVQENTEKILEVQFIGGI